MPNLTWYGHACFGLDFGEGGSVIFDPYEAGCVPGVELPEGLSADLVLCSHEHHDHNARSRVTLTGRAHALRVSFLDTWHDGVKGAERGANRVSVVEYGGFRAVHLGDLGCALRDEELAALAAPALLLIPVGGVYTIGPARAAALADALRPETLVPMHYRRGRMGFDVLADVADFAAAYGGPALRIMTPGETLAL